MREHTLPSSYERGGRHREGRLALTLTVTWSCGFWGPGCFPHLSLFQKFSPQPPPGFSGCVVLLLLLFVCFHLFLFNWRITALQCCVGFCHTSAWTSHMYACFPSLLNIALTSHPSHPSRLLQSTWLSSLCYTANSHWLSVLQMAIHISLLFSQFILPSPSVSTGSFSVCLFLPCK